LIGIWLLTNCASAPINGTGLIVTNQNLEYVLGSAESLLIEFDMIPDLSREEITALLMCGQLVK